MLIHNVSLVCEHTIEILSKKTQICRLLYKSTLFLVFGLILWKWMNGVESTDSNQECKIGFKKLTNGVSQCLAYTCTRKHGNRRSAEGLRSFKSSNGTNLITLLILAGDMEMNPSPRFQCRLCKKYCKASDKVIECEDCEKRFHASYAKLGDNELLKLEAGNGSWYCTNYKADCGLCSGAVLKDHKAVQCDNCEIWVHNGCSFITESQYETLQNTNCTWICPKCEIFYLFQFLFFDDQLNLENQNTVMILSFRTYRSWQTVQTQIRLLLEEQSGQGLHCLQFPLHLLDS